MFLEKLDLAISDKTRDFLITPKELKDTQDYDEMLEKAEKYSGKIYVTFESNQIKSAIPPSQQQKEEFDLDNEKIGKFDENNDNIYYEPIIKKDLSNEIIKNLDLNRQNIPTNLKFHIENSIRDLNITNNIYKKHNSLPNTIIIDTNKSKLVKEKIALSLANKINRQYGKIIAYNQTYSDEIVVEIKISNNTINNIYNKLNTSDQFLPTPEEIKGLYGIKDGEVLPIFDVYNEDIINLEPILSKDNTPLNEQGNIFLDKLGSVLNNKSKFKGLTKDGNLIDLESGEEYEYYYNTETREKYTRATTYISNGKTIKESSKLKSSQIIGNKVDRLVRDYFANNLQPLENYELASDTIVKNFIKQLDKVKENLDKRGETVIANDILLYDETTKTAGTVDLLTFDKEGNVNIYDMKTMLGNYFKETYGKSTIPKYYDNTRAWESYETKHNKQLSIYRIMMYNTNGILAKNVAIIPIEVKYEGGDIKTTKLNLLKGVSHIPLNSVKKAILSNPKTESNTVVDFSSLGLDYSNDNIDTTDNSYMTNEEKTILYKTLPKKVNTGHFINFIKSKIFNNYYKMDQLKSKKKHSSNLIEKNKLREEISKLYNYTMMLKKILQNSKHNNYILDVANSDLDYISYLMKDTVKNRKEINDLIEYYKRLGDFNLDKEHPLFENLQDILDQSVTNEHIAAMLQTFKDIRDNFIKIENELIIEDEKITENILKNNQKLQKLFDNKTVTIDDLTKDIDDIGLWDKLMHNVSTNTFSKDSLIPQIMTDELRKTLDLNRAEVSKIISKLDTLQSKVESKLKNSKNSGLIATSYDIFFQKTKLGHKTGNLVNRYSAKWFTEYDTYVNEIFKTNDYKEAINKRNKWLRENANMFEFYKVPEIYETFKDTDFKDKFKIDNNFKNEFIQEYGKNLYDELVQTSIEKLKEYLVWQEISLNQLLEDNKVSSIDELDSKILYKYRLSQYTTNPFNSSNAWINNNGILEDDQGGKYTSSISYNTFFPKKTKHAIDEVGRSGNIDTGYYDNNFNIIDNDTDIYEYWKLLQEASEYISTSFSDNNMNLPFNSIPALEKSFAEMLITNEKKGGIFNRFRAFITYVIDKFKNGIGVKNSDTNIINTNINKNYIDNRNNEINLLFHKLSLQWEDLAYTDSNIIVNNLTNEQIQFVSKILGVKPSKQAIHLVIGNSITSENFLSYIHSYSYDSITQEYSQDVPKIFRTALMLAAEYNGRKQAEPIMNIFKKHYNEIENTKKETGKSAISKLLKKDKSTSSIDNFRENAIKRMDFFYKKAVQGNFETNNYGLFKGFKTIKQKDRKIFNSFMEFLRTGKVYTKMEKELIKNLDNSIELAKNNVIKELDSQITRFKNSNKLKEVEKYTKILEELRNNNLDNINSLYDLANEKLANATSQYEAIVNEKENIGSRVALSSVVSSIYSAIIFKGLAYNISSAITNRIEGKFSNIIADSTGFFWTQGNLDIAENFIIQGFKRRIDKNSEFSKNWKMLEILMTKYRILQEASNEMQKNSVKSSIKNLHKASPYHLSVNAIEFRNQGSDVLAMLMDIEIKDVNGKTHKIFDGKQFNIFDIQGEDIVLKPEFKTEENIRNWEDMQGNDYLSFKSKIITAISTIHGDYEDIGGMLLKQTDVGKGLGLFKTWLPMQFWLRLAKPGQKVMGLDLKDFKGRWWSNTTFSGTLLGVLSGATVGPAGMIIGGIGGYLLGAKNQANGVKMEATYSKQMLVISKEILKKTLLLPLNLFGIAGKHGKINLDKLGMLNKLDEANLKANITDISLLLMMMIFKLMLSAIRAGNKDDDDEENSYMENIKYKSYLLLENKTMNLISNATFYTRPRTVYDTYTQSAVYSLILQMEKMVEAIEKAFEGDYVYKSGINKGKNRIMVTTKKTVIPAFVNDLGIGSYTKKDWTPDDYWDKVFDVSGKKEREKEKEQKKKEKELKDKQNNGK